MKPIIILLLVPLVFGPVGYFAGKQMGDIARAPSTATLDSKPRPPILFKMPLGGLTIQIMQPDSIVHIVMDLDVYLAGAQEFERLSGAHGKAELRDGTIAVVSDLAESLSLIKDGDEKKITAEDLAVKITRKLYQKFHSVRSAQINKLLILRTRRPKNLPRVSTPVQK